jgi:hypothetical protein
MSISSSVREVLFGWAGVCTPRTTVLRFICCIRASLFASGSTDAAFSSALRRRPGAKNKAPAHPDEIGIIEHIGQLSINFLHLSSWVGVSMGRKLSHQALGILRATLEKVEQDPDLGENNPGVSDFRRIVLNRVAEMEEPALQATQEHAPASAIGTALKLAAALVAEPAANLDAEGALDPVNPALAAAEVTPLLAEAVAKSSTIPSPEDL